MAQEPNKTKSNRIPFHLIVSLLWLMLSTIHVQAQDKTLAVRPLSDAPSFAKRALVIGIGQYEHAGSLAPTTYNDAQRFADLLRTQFKFPDDSITLLTDAPGTPNSQMPTYIHLRNAFNTLLAGVTDKSEVVIYYSGHGTRSDDHDWLVPMDGLPSDVLSTCINYDDFKSRLNTRTPARALLIVDACRNLSGGKDAGSSGFGASKALTGPQFAELLSCLPKEESKVGKPEDFEESVFTHFLLQGLRGDADAQTNGIVTFDSLNEYVQGHVSQYVSKKYGEAQNPEGRASQGAMVLAKVGAGIPPVLKPIVPDMQLNPDVEKITLPGGIAGRLIRGSSRPQTAQAGDVRVNPKDGAEMVYIPAGSFAMGDDDDATITKFGNPRHTVKLSGFWIYKNVVTVRQYKAYCQAMNLQVPPAPDFDKTWSQDDHPIVNVSWDDAQGYCAWAGVHLPTEAQWEKAARGPNGSKFPWGDAFDISKVWASKSAFGDAGGTTAVGVYGISGYGLSDMAGNVFQWCADWYDGGFWSSRAAESADPVNLGVGEQKYRALRGGSWDSFDPVDFRSAYRISDAPTYRYYGLGFRCASGPN